jgi:hypothetical protein
MSVLSVGAARAGIIAIAAAGALSLLALPSAAHAADVVTCTPTVTAATQPWLTFSGSANSYVPFGETVAAYLDASLDLTTEFPASFTAADLDEYEQATTAAEQTFLDSIEAVDLAGGSLLLTEQLTAIDPENTTGWQEKLLTLTGEFEKEVAYDAPEFTQAFPAFLNAQVAFLDSASAVVDANEPAGGPYVRPAIPATLQTDRDAAVAGLQRIAEIYQSSVLDGAAIYVVYEDVCVTTIVADAPAPASVTPAKTLAATGTSDGIALGSTAGLLLLVGATVTAVTVRRRRSA